MKANQIFRAVFFLAIFVLFVIAALVAIIFAQGRTLNDDGTITQTSIVQVNTVPRDVEVYLDGQRATLSDYKVEWIEPGLRTIKISKPGYKDWEKVVKLEAGIVKQIYAQLYPDQLSFTKLTSTSIDRVFFSDNSEYAYYTVLENQNASQVGLWRLKLSRNFLDFGNNTPVLISNLSKYQSILLNNPYNIVISPDNNRVLIQIPSQNILDIIEVNRQNQDRNIVEMLGYYPDKIYWFRGSESIVVEKNNLLFEYELSSAQKSLIDFSFENRLIYSVNANYVLFQNTQDKKLYNYTNKFSTILDSKIIKEDLSALSSISTIQGSRDIIILKLPDSLVYINLEKEFSEIINNVSSIRKVSSNGRVIIFERDKNLYTLSLENTPNNLSFTIEENRIELNSELISNIYFTPNNRNILFRLNPTGEENIVTLLSFDFDGGNRTVIMEDSRVDPRNNYAVSSDSSNLYLPLKEQVQADVFNVNLYEFDLVVN